MCLSVKIITKEIDLIYLLTFKSSLFADTIQFTLCFFHFLRTSIKLIRFLY